MAYTPDPTDVTQPIGTVLAGTADEEFRALKAYIAALAGLSPISPLFNKVPVRQTVLSGPVDSSGLPAYGGATGATTLVTTAISASAPLVVTAANGFSLMGAVDTIGISEANLTWTGLSTNGTMYLYVDIAAGALTPVAKTLAPVYQPGGTYSITADQFTFNYQEMVGKVGNGAAAVQTYRVCVGEVTVAGGVVTAIIWYALQGRYESAWVTPLPAVGTAVSSSSNIGTTEVTGDYLLGCIANNQGYVDGDRFVTSTSGTGVSVTTSPSVWATRNTIGVTIPDGNNSMISNKTTGAQSSLTLASWKYKFVVKRVF